MNNKFYILIPVYRTEAQIRSCLDSVLAQTYSDYEAVIVDDGSPDAAGRICDEYAADHPNFHVIHQENQGAYMARQTAIDYILAHETRTEGVYVMFLDSDDRYLPNILERVNQALCDSGADMLMFQLACVKPDGTRVWDTVGSSFIGTLTDKADLYRVVFMDDRYNMLHRKAVDLNLFRKAPRQTYLHLNRGEDLILSMSLYGCLSKFTVIPDVLYQYVINPASTTRNINAGNFAPALDVDYKVWQFIQEQNVWTEADQLAYLRDERDYIAQTIRTAASLDGTKDQVRALLEQIRTDEFCRMVLKRVHNCNFWIWLLERQHYSLLCPLARLDDRLRSVVRRLRH